MSDHHSISLDVTGMEMNRFIRIIKGLKEGYELELIIEKEEENESTEVCTGLILTG